MAGFEKAKWRLEFEINWYQGELVKSERLGAEVLEVLYGAGLTNDHVEHVEGMQESYMIHCRKRLKEEQEDLAELLRNYSPSTPVLSDYRRKKKPKRSKSLG